MRTEVYGPVATEEAVVERRRLFVQGLAFRVALAGIFFLAFLVFGYVGILPPRAAVAAAILNSGLVAVNGLYWIVAARRGFPLWHFVVHWAIDIVGVTLQIHIIGGVDTPYAGLAYLSLVTTAAV